MVFSSLTFLLFFLPVVVILYLLCRGDRLKNAVLILASLVFYAFGEPKWILVMILMVFVNYLCGIGIAGTESAKKRKLYVTIGVVFSLGFLFYFKYYSFLLNTVLGLIGTDTVVSDVKLPIGISFYTFQVLTYVVDVYRGKVPAQKSYWRLLLYVSFFPQLIAGPIVNYKDIEGSLASRTITLNGFYTGFLRFVVGLSKKCLLANPCGEVVDNLLGTSSSAGGAWIFAIAYSLQLYFDFSGYSDMAIGLGRMFGFEFRENFLYPYTADSVTDFWRKWHVSLGSFFREYVYIPLGGNRVGKLLWCRNLLIVWALTGFWHGASWNFMLWGIYYGILLMAEKLWLLKWKKRIPKAVNCFVTLVIVVIGWVFFYFTDMSAGLCHVGKMFGIGAEGWMDPYAVYYLKDKLGFLLLAVLSCLPWGSCLAHWKQKKTFSRVWETVAPVLASCLLVLSVTLLIGQSYNPFLYFRF